MIYFLIYLFLEVIISTNIAGSIGGLATFAEIILSAFVGFVIISNFRYSFFENMRSLSSGEISAEEFQRLNLYNVLGALLLILPGFFSDILGILFQFSFVATLIARRIFRFKERKNNKGDDNVIDVEIIDDFDDR